MVQVCQVCPSYIIHGERQRCREIARVSDPQAWARFGRIRRVTILLSHAHIIWLVVSTPLKNISQLGLLFPIYGNIEKRSKPPTSYDYFIWPYWPIWCPICLSSHDLISPCHMSHCVHHSAFCRRLSNFGGSRLTVQAPRSLVHWWPQWKSNDIIWEILGIRLIWSTLAFGQ